MPAMLDLLKEIRPRPLAMYLGRVSILKLADFLRGYEHAVYNLHDDKDFFLGDFGEWLYEKYGLTNESWEQVILHNSANEVEAVDRFWQLLDEFLAARPDLTTQNALTDRRTQKTIAG